MTYFGIDLLPVKIDGKIKLLVGEIGGIDTGRRGFKEIYKDNRVNDTIKIMIKERYGDVLYNHGLFNIVFQKTGLTDPKLVFEYAKNNFKDELEFDNQILTNEDNPFGKELYFGQTDAVVANCINPPAGPKLLNPSMAQFAARNKVVQLSILQDFKNDIPFIKGEIYGARDSDMDVVLGKTGKVILKKVYGSCGTNIEIITEDELLERAKTWVKTGNEMYSDIKGKINTEVKIMQPFYDTRPPNGEYVSIRSVICNEQFIDAYARVSSDPIVNLARGAKPKKINGKMKAHISELSEMIVKEFLRITAEVEKQIQDSKVA